MASTTAGQQQPVLIRGFDVGINPSMVSSMQPYSGQQGNHGGMDMQHTLFGNGSHNRQSSQSSSTSMSASMVIPHGSRTSASISTEDLVDGLQQSMASMDPASHHYQHQHRQAHAARPASSSSTSSPSSNTHHYGNPASGGVSTRPFEVARSPTFTWHGYRPGSSSSVHDAGYTLPPDLNRHLSSPSSFLAAAGAGAGSQQSFFEQSSVDGTPRTPLDLFHLTNINNNHPSNASNSTSSLQTAASSGNVYPFAHANNAIQSSNSTDNLASFSRLQAHAQSKSYSSAFSPSSFLVDGLTSPDSLNPSQTFPILHSLSHEQQQQYQHYQEQQQQQQYQQQSQQQSQQTRLPPLYNNANANEAGLNANNKRPGSTDSGAAERSNAARGNSDSPIEEPNAKGQARGRSQGRTPSSGKAPSAAGKSRSRTRRPSYSRTISPAGSMRLNGTGGTISPGSTSGGTNAQQQQNNTGTNNTAGNTSMNGNNQSHRPTYSNPYAPPLSPYMPGYPSLPNGNVEAALASKPGTSFEQHAYGASAPTLSSAGFNFMKMQEQQALAQAQARAHAQHAAIQRPGSANATMMTQRPGSANSAINTLDILNLQSTGPEIPQRRASDSSTFSPSSLATKGPDNSMGNKNGSATSTTMNSMDLLNNPSAFTGPLPLPHQEGFRSFGTLPDYLNSLNGLDGQSESNQVDNDMESTTRGRQPPDDKRRKRRESHNAVERRRRDNINDRITELASLIPEVLLDTGNTGGTGGKNTSRSRSRNGRGGDNDDSPDRRGDSPSSSTSAFPSNLSSNAQFTPAQLAQQAASNKPNKGVILAKSVDYVRYLQQLVQMQGERNRELEIRLRMYESHALAMGSGGGAGMPSLPNLSNIVINSNQLPPGFAGAVNSNGLVGGAPLGSPGLPLNGVALMRSLPPLEESESTMDEGTGLSHKRDQFTARRSTSRNSMNANDPPPNTAIGSSKSIAVPAATISRDVVSPRQDILTTQDWIDNGFAEMTGNGMSMAGMSSGNNGMMNGHTASPPSSALMLDQHQMTFEDLLRVGRSNRVVSDSQDSLASESPMPSVGKMEEDDENGFGMRT